MHLRSGSVVNFITEIEHCVYQHCFTSMTCKDILLSKKRVLELMEQIFPAIESKYCGEEGIYRLPGNKNRMDILLHKVFYREPIDFDQELQ